MRNSCPGILHEKRLCPERWLNAAPGWYGFVHDGGDDETGGGGQRRDRRDGGRNAQRVCQDSGEQCAQRIASVSPQAVYPNRARPPIRLGDVGDSSQQGWV